MRFVLFVTFIGGVGVSLAGFGGLFSALHQADGGMAPAIYRSRMREIVMSSFRLAFLGFGVVWCMGTRTISSQPPASSARLPW